MRPDRPREAPKLVTGTNEMKKLQALLYPATRPRRATVARIRQAFGGITVLLPAEDLALSGSPDMPIDTIVPALLEDRLSWFNRLIADWKAWARDMGPGHGMLAEAIGRSTAYGPDETTQGIMDELRHNTADNPLLDAQLILRIAHETDERDEALEEEIEGLAPMEEALRLALHGETEGRGSSSQGLPPSIPPLERPALRLRAWAVLARKADTKGLLPLGEGIAVKDLVDRSYESLTHGKPPREILRLWLTRDPGIRPGCDDAIGNDLLALVESMKSGGTDVDGLSEAVKSRWAELTSGQETGPELCLTLYPGRSLASILAGPTGAAHGPEEDGLSFFLI